MPSTVIRSFDYHPANRALDVTFVSGRAYRYADVPEPLAQAFSRARSKGRFFNDRIRDAFRFTRIDPEPINDDDLWEL